MNNKRRKGEIETYAAPHQHKYVFYLHLNSFVASKYTIPKKQQKPPKKTQKKIGLNEHKHDVIKHFTEFSSVFVCYLSNKIHVCCCSLKCNVLILSNIFLI